MPIKWVGPILIAVAAVLWGTDAVVRTDAVAQLDPTLVVLTDHVIGMAVLSVWVLARFRTQLFTLSRGEWVAAALVGAGGSAVATLLFTASFQYVNPTLPVLLQKLQPVWVVFMAYLFLGERPRGRFFLWGAIALISAVILSFPDLDFRFYLDQNQSYFKGVALALGAAVLWGAATVGGKILLKRTPSSVAIFWRYFFALLTLGGLVFFRHLQIPWNALESRSLGVPLLYLALMTGIIPMISYYKGLARTSAGVATFVELLYPVSAVLINLVFLNVSLSPVQIVAAGVLLVAVTTLSL